MTLRAMNLMIQVRQDCITGRNRIYAELTELKNKEQTADIVSQISDLNQSLCDINAVIATFTQRIENLSTVGNHGWVDMDVNPGRTLGHPNLDLKFRTNGSSIPS